MNEICKYYLFFYICNGVLDILNYSVIKKN